MSERIQGLSISLDLETAGVERSLSQIKNSFSSLRRSAQVNMNNMKFDSKDLKTYKRNLDGLSDSYERQEQNVDDISKRMKQMEEAGKGNTEEFKKLNAEYNRQVDELNKLGHALDRAQEGLRDVYNESSRLTQLGNTFSNIGSSLQDVGSRIQGVGTQIQGVGRGLTRHITMPAVGVVSAIGGITAAFGWGRLTSLDTAQAQLKGLGYETEDVERITDGLVDTLDGGMMTMGDAVFASANAMAAGVEEGKELDKYIRMLDASVQGGTGTFEEMEQIFSRVADQGSLTRTEFDMIQKRIPGFSSAVQEHFGVSQDAMYEMLRNGEVTLDEFLKIMEDHGGAFAEEYSQTWAGMVENTKNYVGIIGETLLGGVFDQAKEAIAEFIEFLKSDEVVAWAERAGDSISTAFGNIVDSVKSGIDWFVGLGAEKQKLIGIMAAVAVAAGPVLTVFGGLVVGIGSVVKTLGGLFSGLGSLFKWFGSISGGIKMIVKEGAKFAKVFPKMGAVVKGLGVAFKVLTGPVGWTIGAIIAVGTAFTVAYKKSETFRDFIHNIGGMLKSAWDSVVDFGGNVKTAFEGIFAIFKGDHTSGNELLRGLGLSESTIDTIFLAIHNIKSFFEDLKETAQENLERIKSFFIDRFNQIKSWWGSTGQGIFDSLVETFNRVKDDVSNALSGVKDFFISIFEDIGAWWDRDGTMIFDAVGTVFENAQKRGERAWSILSKAVEIGIDIITGLVEMFAPIVEGIFNVLWPTIVYLTQTAWEKIKLAIGIAMDLVQGIISGVSALIEGDWSKFGEVLKDTAQSIWNRVVEFFGNMKDNALELMNDLTGGGIDKFIDLRDGLINRAIEIKDGVVNRIIEMKDGVIEWVTDLYNGVTQWFSDLWTGIREKTSEIRDGVVDRFTQLKDRVIEKVDEIFGPTFETFQNIYTAVTSKVEEIRVTLTEIWDRIKEIITTAVRITYERVRDRFLEMYNNVTERIENLRIRLDEIWTAIRTRITEIVTNLYNRVRDWFLNIYNNVNERTQNTRNRVSEIWNNLRDRVVNTVKNLYNRVRDWFLSIYNTVRDRTRSARNTAVNWFGSMRDRVIEIAKYIWEKVSGWFSSIYTAIHDKMRDAKNKAVEFAEDLYTGAKEQFESLVDASRDMMDGIGDWIDEKRSAVINKAKSLGTGIANAAIRGFNSLIGGINKVADFLGVSKSNQISPISLLGGSGGSIGAGNGYRAIRASKGLKNHKGGDVLVGDKGPGNSIGGGSSTREIVQLPDGKNFLMDGNIMLRNAPKGLRVNSNKDTEAILANNPQLNPDLTGGSGALNNMLRPVTRMLENQQTTAKVSHDVTSDIMAYADNPAQLAKDVIDQFTSFDLPKVPFDMAWAAVRNTTTAMGNKFKEWFEAFGSGGDGSHILGKKILQTFGLYRGNIGFNLGKHYGLDTAHKFDPLLSPVNGRVSRIWNDYGGGKSLQITTDKYIWWFMHLSNIMKRVGDTVKTGMRLGTTGNSGNYVVGSGHLHTQVHPRSKGAGNFNAIDPLPVLKGLSGHKLGGYIQRGGLFNLHDDEFVINPNHPTEAMKLIAIAGKKLAGKSKQTRELPNPGRYEDDNNQLEIINLLTKQNQILMKLLNKDSNVYMDGQKINDQLSEIDSVNAAVQF